MTPTTRVRHEERDDAALITAVRTGDTDAYGVLFERHVDAARRLARTLAPHGDADDLVSEAFAKVLPVLVRGDGPDLAFRPYLLTAVRRLDLDRHRALARTRPTDDDALLDTGAPTGDSPGPRAVAGFESEAAARAFASLPERWQVVLWHTEVEGQRPAEVAPLLGLSPNAVSQLAHRAREGLRQAFVSMHVHEAGTARAACQTTRANLGAYIRAGLSSREAARVSAHLECCRPCTAIYLELVEVDTDLRGLLAPLLLGGAATAYLAEPPVTAAAGTSGTWSGALGTAAGKALAGALAAGCVVTAVVLGGNALPGGGAADRGDRAGARPHLPRAAHPAGRHVGPAVAEAAGETGPGVEPAAQHSPESPGVPSQDPSGVPSGQQQQPAHQPGHQGHPPPAPPEDTDPTPLADTSAVDVRVTAESSGTGPAAVVRVEVAGLGAGHTGTLTVSADRLSASVQLDPGCDLVRVDVATCRLTGDGGLTLAAAAAGVTGPTTLTLTAVPAGGLHEASSGDNTAQVVLGG